jgi:hypothetical protein
MESGHRRWNPVSPNSGDQSGRIWIDLPDFDHLIGRIGWIPAIWPDLAREPNSGRLAREAGSRQAGRIRPDPSGRPDGRNPAVCARFRRNCMNPAIPDFGETAGIR